MPSYDDLVIEKEGEQVLAGHYYHHPSGDLISDPVLAFDYNGGYWYPVRIEQVLGDTICSFIENGKRMIYERRIKEFKSFQRMFARNIKEQRWLEDGGEGHMIKVKLLEIREIGRVILWEIELY